MISTATGGSTRSSSGRVTVTRRIDRASRELRQSGGNTLFLGRWTAMVPEVRASVLLPLFLALDLGLGCETYVAPPGIDHLSVEAGVYDPEGGPLSVKLTKPVDLATLSLSLFVDHRGTEGDLCLGMPLPEGCSDDAALQVLGPCAPKTAMSDRTEDGRTRFLCAMGGAIIVSTDRTEVVLELEGKLVPFQRYTLDLASGLTSAEGANTAVPTQARFSVKSDIARGPTDFQPGMFFAVVDIFEPIPAQFQFWFWFAVKPETGQLAIYAADADPKDMSIDPKVNRIPADWVSDPVSDKGATLSAVGQIADIGGQRLIRFFPFHLLVIVPPVEAVATEVSARVSRGEFLGAPAIEREIIEGTMSSPAVFLGLDAERAALGPGRGAIALFRLTPEEAIPVSALLGRGVTEQDVINPVFPE